MQVVSSRTYNEVGHDTINSCFVSCRSVVPVFIMKLDKIR